MAELKRGIFHWNSLVAKMVKNLPAVQETWVHLLGWEDPLEKGMATHSSILACRSPWTEDPGGLQSLGSQTLTQLSDTLSFTFTGIKSCWLTITLVLDASNQGKSA